eukprot:8706495-Ditylum_brightwellii.AAC.1
MDQWPSVPSVASISDAELSLSFQRSRDDLSVVAAAIAEIDDVDSDDVQVISQEDIDCLSLICDSITIESIALKSMSVEEETRIQENHLKVIHEGPSTRVVCFCDTANRFGGSRFTAIKSLNDEFADERHASRLKNEYNISKHLVHCSATRAALFTTELRGCPSIFLEWVTGVTLTEWIKSVHKEEIDSDRPLDINSLMIITQLAWGISRSLCKIHDAGVTHNNLKPENIIVQTKGEKDIVSIKIIGL